MKIIDNEKDYADLKVAVELLTASSLTAQLSNLVGTPIETLIKKLPESASKKIHSAVDAALHKATDAAIWTMDDTPNKPASTIAHKLMAAGTGALGGLFGVGTVLLEIPISTTIMMRAVADIARSEGFNLSDLSTKQSCLEVFALGGVNDSDDAAETAYYMTRAGIAQIMNMFSKELSDMAVNMGTKQALSPAQIAKWMTKLIEVVATRYGIVITEKLAAQIIPVVGAVAGAAINTLFTDFYQDMAKGHFIVKRLENKYGYEQIKQEFEKLIPKK